MVKLLQSWEIAADDAHGLTSRAHVVTFLTVLRKLKWADRHAPCSYHRLHPGGITPWPFGTRYRTFPPFRLP